MLTNYSVSLDDFMSEPDSETMKQIIVSTEPSSNDNCYIYLSIVIVILLLILSYLLYFKYEWVYKISESWKSYTLNECTDGYRVKCRISAVITLLIALCFVLYIVSDGEFDILGFLN